jgi:hypothetical protein
MFFVMYVLGDAFWGNEDAKIGALSSAFSMTFEMNFEDVLGSDSTRWFWKTTSTAECALEDSF